MPTSLTRVLLPLVVVACSAATTSSSSVGALSQAGYDPSLAVAYADANWDNGEGLCAEFTSRSLMAGNLGIGVITYVPTLVSALSSVAYEEHNQGDSITANSGDIVVYSDDTGDGFCDADSDEYNCGHVCVIVVAGSSESSAEVDCHNNAHYHLPLGDILGGGYSTYRIYHVGGNQAPPDTVGCSTDSDCNQGAGGTQDVCAAGEGYCIEGCHSDFDCPDGYSCTATSPHWSCQ